MSDSVQLHGQQPTRFLCTWDCLGKNTGVGCHFLLRPLYNLVNLISCFFLSGIIYLVLGIEVVYGVWSVLSFERFSSIYELCLQEKMHKIFQLQNSIYLKLMTFVK